MKAAQYELKRKAKNEIRRQYSGNIHDYQMWRDRVVNNSCRTQPALACDPEDHASRIDANNQSAADDSTASWLQWLGDIRNH